MQLLDVRWWRRSLGTTFSTFPEDDELSKSLKFSRCTVSVTDIINVRADVYASL